MPENYSPKDDMYRLAGKDLVEKMIDVLESEDNAERWFYSPLIALGGKRPYDCCMNRNISDIEELLIRIEHGVLS
jgi:uncharacterized protein (DUF2384 family)